MCPAYELAARTIQAALGAELSESIFIGGGGEAYGEKQGLTLKYANRHGLIAGATGTGKTVTLQIMAEGFAAQGVPVFLSDVKGDLAGLGQNGQRLGQAARCLHLSRGQNRV